MFKLISEKIHNFVGGWAWFIGGCMADGYVERINEIQEEMDAEDEAEEKAVMGFPSIKVN